ncbi:quinone oxidoreductase-like isoform X2 [Asterias amurensis]
METTSKMNGVVIDGYGGPEVLKHRSDVDVPTPGAKQILVKIKSAGINSVEGRVRQGLFLTSLFKPQSVMGVDGSGVVEQVGGEVTKFKPGDRVYVVCGRTGTYAEYTLANEDNLYLLHDKLSFNEGAVLPIPYFTAHRALVKRARIEKGESVLIQGASGQVGLACIQIARAFGATTIVGTAGTPEGRNLVMKQGADFAIDYRAEDYKDQMKTAFADKNIDVIIEMNCDTNIALDMDIIGEGGRIVIVGKKGEAKCDPSRLMLKEALMMGSGLRLATEEDRELIARDLYAGVEEGWLRPHINKVYSLEEAGTAHWEMENQRGALGKSIIAVE